MSEPTKEQQRFAQVHLPVSEAWLATTFEEAVEPGLEIIDTHHHLWDKPRPRYLLDEFLADASGGHRLMGSVYVESRAMYRQDVADGEKPLGETEFANGMAAMAASGVYGPARVCDGIVGFVDLRLPNAAELLQQHVRIAGPRFKGVRNLSAWHPDPEVSATSIVYPKDLLSSADFRRGLGALTDMDLVFDAFMFHTQLNDLIDLARAFPRTRIVLDHYGAPVGVGPFVNQREAVFREWRESMRRLSAFPNVFVKLGGFAMRITGFGFDRQDKAPTSDELATAWQPYFDEVVNLFGVERCMFESNFPVDKGSCSYTVLWNAYKKMSLRLPDAQRRQLLSGTARQVYRLQ
ncbi:amidohydrolase family protein [Bordetella sp. 15P40C-2]|nr:amidohydrolase family protein [Bordetella sp. 15P40C-2]